MIRIVTATAALAVVLVAAPASAEDSIRISTAGKSSAQVEREIRIAARTLCAKENGGPAAPLWAYATCVQNSVAEALKSRAYIQLASR